LKQILNGLIQKLGNHEFGEMISPWELMLFPRMTRIAADILQAAEELC
jgi:hypothetical protein